MSHEQLMALLDELEQLLQAQPAAVEALVAWQARFDQELAQADRTAADWPRVRARSHALAARLDQEARGLEARQEAIRQEVELQGRGSRALKGYRPA